MKEPSPKPAYKALGPISNTAKRKQRFPGLSPDGQVRFYFNKARGNWNSHSTVIYGALKTSPQPGTSSLY